MVFAVSTKMANIRQLFFFLSIYFLWNILELTSGRNTENLVNNFGVIDDLREDDHGEFELSDIIALSLEVVYTENLVPPTPEEREENVNLHNAYRRNFSYPFVETADMIMMENNNTIEYFAGEMLKFCEYKHQFSANDNTTDVIGQNIYRGPTKSVSRALHIFYGWEYPNYYFNNYTCMKPKTPKRQCGHMIQMMMGQSAHVGFNRKYDCWPRVRGGMLSVHYIVGAIDFFPQFYQFKYGTPCSHCNPGYYCSADLCIPDHQRFCEAYNIDCECKLNCLNCGTPDFKICKCICKSGWDWGWCQYPCRDNLEFYMPDKFIPGSCYASYRRGACHHRNPDYRDNYCRKSCKTCNQVAPKSEPAKLCCGGKKCDAFYVLDLDTCECKLNCPSLLCLYNYTTTTTAPKIHLTITSASQKVAKKPTGEKEPRPTNVATTVVSNFKILLLIWLTLFLTVRIL